MHTYVRILTWTPERVAKLKRLHEDGFSRAQIAQELGTSKSAIHGKLHRLGLSKPVSVAQEQHQLARRTAERPRKKRARKAQADKPAEPPKTKPKPAPLPPRQPQDIARVRLLDAEDHHCRFIPGEPSEMMFCGDQVVPGTSYCKHHLERCRNSSNEPRQPLKRNIPKQLHVNGADHLERQLEDV
jgi:GcrA cell cycle regulator